MGGGVGGEVAGAVQGTATCGGKRGILRLGVGDNPTRPSNPQRGLPTIAPPLFSLVTPYMSGSRPLSCGPASLSCFGYQVSPNPLQSGSVFI